jgi:plasmid maintenance system antidote protein VapI
MFPGSNVIIVDTSCLILLSKIKELDLLKLPGRRSVTGDTAIRFSLALGTSPEMWLRLQYRYELEKALDESEPDLKDKIKPILR